jgi:pilus assembly protein FimV
LSDTQLRAVLASEAEFAKLKLVRDWRYTQLRFQVDLQNPADPAIVVSSDTAIKEPSMDFLVELSWPNGKLVRGYTVLLEKP